MISLIIFTICIWIVYRELTDPKKKADRKAARAFLSRDRVLRKNNGKFKDTYIADHIRDYLMDTAGVKLNTVYQQNAGCMKDFYTPNNPLHASDYVFTYNYIGDADYEDFHNITKAIKRRFGPDCILRRNANGGDLMIAIDWHEFMNCSELRDHIFVT